MPPLSSATQLTVDAHLYNPQGYAGIAYLFGTELDPECQGNGIDWEGGNELHASGGIVQAYSQYGVKMGGSVTGGGTFWGKDGFHNEAGNCSNPLGNIGKAGYINLFGAVNVDGAEIGGAQPTFTPTSTGSIHYAYYIQPHTSAGSPNGWGGVLPLGMVTNGPATINGSGEVPISWYSVGNSQLATDYNIYRVPVESVYSGTYTSGITATGTGTCIITFSGGQSGGNPGTATVAVTGGSVGSTLTITYGGQAYYAGPTTGTVTKGTATTCSGSSLLVSTTLTFDNYNLIIPTVAGNWLVANVAQSGGAGTVQTYTDSVTTTTSVTPGTCCWTPELDFWGGGVILSTTNDNSFDIGSYSGPATSGGFVQSGGSLFRKINFTAGVLSYGADNSLSSAYWPSGIGVSTQAYGTEQTLFLPSGVGIYSGSIPFPLTGIINTEDSGNNDGPTDVITMRDTNYNTTLANVGKRRAATLYDTAIGLDVYNGAGLAFRAQTSISNYISTLADGSSWIERLTSSGLTLAVPITINYSGWTGTSCLEEVSGLIQPTGSACGAGGGSGTVNNAAQYDIPYYSSSGTTDVLSGAAISGLQFDSTSGAPAAATSSQIQTAIGPYVYATPLYSTPSVNSTGNISGVTMATTPASGQHGYLYSYVVELTALGSGCVGSTTVQIYVYWNDDVVTGGSHNQLLTTLTIASLGNGTLGPITGGSGVWPILTAATSQSINYNTANYTLGTSCTVNPGYQIYPALVQLY